MNAEIVAAIVGPIVTGACAFLLFRYKNKKNIEELKENLHHQIENKSLEVINSLADDMMKEFRADINELKSENETLRKQLVDAREKIVALERDIDIYREMVKSMENELATLRAAVKFYETQMNHISNCPFKGEERP